MCKCGVYGELIGYDVKGRAYYVSALDVRICRVEKVVVDVGLRVCVDLFWLMLFVILLEVIVLKNML